MRSAKKPSDRKPRPVTRARIENAALHYLGRFASSAQNLRRVLLRRVKRAELAPDDPAYGEALGWIEALIVRFQASGLLDDRGYAAAQAASLNRRGVAQRGIARRLTLKGVGAPEIEAALDSLHDAPGDVDLRAACALARRRRLGPYRAKSERRERRDKDLAALGRAGFAYGIARQVVDAPDVAALEAELREPGEGARVPR